MSEKKSFFKSKDTVLEDALNDEISTQAEKNDTYEEVVIEATDKSSIIVEKEEVFSTTSISAASEEIVSTASAERKNKKKKFYLRVYDAVSTVMGSFIIIALIFVFLFRLVGVDGQSMTNTLQHGDWVLTTNKTEYVQGDIIVITQDTYFHTPLIKRVIAVGGQTIDIDYETATVYIDGVAIDEPYVRENYILQKMDDCTFPYTVPEGKLFCMGDNRNGSTDSRSSLVGPVDERQVLGKAIIRLLPFGNPNIYDYE